MLSLPLTFLYRVLASHTSSPGSDTRNNLAEAYPNILNEFCTMSNTLYYLNFFIGIPRTKPPLAN